MRIMRTGSAGSTTVHCAGGGEGAIRGTQRQLEAIRDRALLRRSGGGVRSAVNERAGQRRALAVTDGKQTQPVAAIRSHPKPSNAIRSHPKPSEAIRSHQKPTEANRSRPKPSEAIRS